MTIKRSSRKRPSGIAVFIYESTVMLYYIFARMLPRDHVNFNHPAS